MKTIVFWKVLWGYIRKIKKSSLLYISIFLIFYIIFLLNHQMTDAVLYAFLLCTVLSLVAAGVDFSAYYRRYRILEQQKSRIIYDLEQMPKPRGLFEETYDEMLRSLYADKSKSISKYDRRVEEAAEYYTLWVHQIKTPIAAMRLLLQSEDTEENKELLVELFKVEQYVEMVLSYLRMNSDATDYLIRKYELESIVKHSVKKYAPLFIRKKIKLELREMHETVLTDEKWLSFVIEQILSNSLKYTAKGSISIYTEPKGVLVIEDTGIGIASEDLPRVCENGFTGYNGRSDKKATGLGLYLSKQILKKLHHSIEIESQVHVGTKVKIDLRRENIRVE